MVDYYGRWTPEDNYSIYPQKEWCNYDYVADYIMKSNYVPRTSIKNLTEMLVAHFDGETEDNEMFCPRLNDDVIINIKMLNEFVEASGGLKEFDYEC